MTNNLNYLIFLLFFQSIIIFFITKKNIDNIFYFLRKIFNDEKTTNIILSLLFFPGTIVHEFSHFFAAIVLFLNVRGIEIFPKFEKDQIKLGTVLYEKKDPIRGVLVGIAPFFGALLVFFVISYFNLFPSNNLGLNIALFYLIFTISSVMFSSKQDLVDLIYLIPFILIFFLVVYLFDIKINISIKNQLIINWLKLFLEKTNYMLFLSLLIHLLIFVLFSIKKINKK